MFHWLVLLHTRIAYDIMKSKIKTTDYKAIFKKRKSVSKMYEVVLDRVTTVLFIYVFILLFF